MSLRVVVLLLLLALAPAAVLEVSNDRTRKAAFSTISAAAAQAKSGDTVLIRGGVYREWVRPARGGSSGSPITYMAKPGEDVVVKGSVAWKPAWKPAGGAGCFQGRLEPSLFEKDFNPFKVKAKAFDGTLGMVFVDGKPLKQVKDVAAMQATAGSWCCENGDLLSIHFPTVVDDPSVPLTEVVVRRRVFAPTGFGLGYITLDGLRFEHAANQYPSGFWEDKSSPQEGMVGTGAGNHWIIRNCMIRWAESIGLDAGCVGAGNHGGSSDHLVVNNTISDNGACGLAIYNTQNTRVIANIVERNHWYPWSDNSESGGIKTHGFKDGVIEGNLVRDNQYAGIWMNTNWSNARVTRNVVVGNNFCGIYWEEEETGYGLCDNNVVTGTVGTGLGINLWRSGGVVVANNLSLRNHNEGHGIGASDMTQVLQQAPCRIVNNLLIGNTANATVGLPNPKINVCDWNAVDTASRYAIAGKQADIAAWRALGYDANGRVLEGLQANFDLAAMTLDLTIDAGLLAMRCPPVPGCDRDFLGAALPAKPIPGPIQGLVAGRNTFKIWPVPDLLPFDGRVLVHLRALATQLENGTIPGTVLAAAEKRLEAKDEAEVAEAQFVVSWLTAKAQARLDRAAQVKEASPAAWMQQMQTLAKDFPLHALGKQAAEEIKVAKADPGFMNEIKAIQELDKILELEGQLQPVPGATRSDAAYFKVNKAVMNKIATLAKALVKRYPDSRAAVTAQALAETYSTAK